MRLAGDASCFLNLKDQLWYNFGLLVGQDFTQVEAYDMEEGINLTHVPALITVLKTAFGGPDGVARAE
jgi:hypothetical protein